MTAQIQIAVVASSLTNDAHLAPRLAREAGFAGIQFDAFSQMLNVTELSVSGRRDLCRVLGGQNLQLIGLRVELGPRGFGIGADVERMLSRLQAAIAAAVGLGAPLVCIDVGPLSEQAELALAQLARLADRDGATLALRSELASFSDIAGMLSRLNCPWLGVDLDPAAMVRDAWKTPEILAKLGPAIRHVRGRDALASAGHQIHTTRLGRGGTNWKELLSTLDTGGFHGWITIDPIELNDCAAAAKAGLNHLRSL